MEIARRIGLPPEAMKQSEPDLPGRKNQRNLWRLRSRLDLEAPLELQVKDILDQLDANNNEFVELSRELGGTMQLVGYFRDVSPGVHFDLETVRRCADYGLCIDCDFYNCC